MYLLLVICLETTYEIINLNLAVSFMEFSTIGHEDSLDEAKLRLQSVEILVVWGEDEILGIVQEKHLNGIGTCGENCELDTLIDPTKELLAKWNPKFIIYTEEGEPISVVDHQQS